MVSATQAIHPERKCNFIDSILLNPDTPMVIGNIAGEVRSIHSIASSIVPELKKFTRSLVATQFVSILNAPFNISEVITGVFKVITEKGKQRRIDNGLELAMNIGQLGEDISGIAATINELRPLLSGFSWVAPLSVASVALSVVNYAINARNIFWSRKIIKQLDETPLKKVFKEHRYHLEKQCGVNPQLVKKALKSGNEALAVKEIKKRIKCKTACHALALVITTIGIVTTIIFLTMTASPLLLAGSALLAILFALGITKKCVDYFSERKLKNKISQIASATFN